MLMTTATDKSREGVSEKDISLEGNDEERERTSGGRSHTDFALKPNSLD